MIEEENENGHMEAVWEQTGYSQCLTQALIRREVSIDTVAILPISKYNSLTC